MLNCARMKAPDRIDVARHAMGQILSHPVTWAPFLPVAGAYAFIGVPWWVCLPLLLAVVIVVLLAWGRQWPQLMDKARTELLTRYCAAENLELGQRMQRVAQVTQRWPDSSLLDAVREAMGIKQAVENRLFADGVITAHEEEVGAMIGETVRTMVEETERLALTEKGEISRGATARFNKAAETLRRAYAEIDVILDPVPEDLRLPAENDALSRASERLDEKLQQARGVRRHLERGLIVPDTAASPGTEPSSRHPEKSPAMEG